MRIRPEHVEGLLDHYEAGSVVECPQVLECRIKFGEIRVKESGWQASRSLRDPELFLSFARLGGRGNPSYASISKWVKDHGLPRRTRGGSGKSQDEMFMYVEEFKKEASDAHQLLSLYAEIRGRRLEAIKARVASSQSVLDESLRKAFESREYRRSRSMFVDKDDFDLFWASRVLADALTEKLGGVRPRLRAESAAVIAQSWHCADLCSAMYLQLTLLVTGRKVMRQCKFCGTPFPLTRSDKRYCNSTCRSQARHFRR
jgi:hypothetical protein